MRSVMFGTVLDDGAVVLYALRARFIYWYAIVLHEGTLRLASITDLRDDGLTHTYRDVYWLPTTDNVTSLSEQLHRRWAEYRDLNRRGELNHLHHEDFETWGET